MNQGGRTFDSSRRQIRHGSDRAWAELTGKYLDELPRQLHEIVLLLEVEDYPAVKHHAHRAKGTSATYRLVSISEGFARMEHFADSRDAQAIAETVDGIMRMIRAEAGKRTLSDGSSARDPKGGCG